MALCIRGANLSMLRARTSGRSSNGVIFNDIVENVSKNDISRSGLIKVNITGESMATEMFEMIEKVARRGTFPPSIPVMTGAAVAVGQKIHINAPCAISLLKVISMEYTVNAPIICTESNNHENCVALNSLGVTLQNVINSIAKIRYGAKNSTCFMKS